MFAPVFAQNSQARSVLRPQAIFPGTYRKTSHYCIMNTELA